MSNNSRKKNEEILAAFRRLSSRQNLPEPGKTTDERAAQVAKPSNHGIFPGRRSDDNSVPGTIIRGQNIQFQQQNYYSEAQQTQVRDHQRQSAPRTLPETQSTSQSRPSFFNVQAAWKMGRRLLYLFLVFLAMVTCAMVHVIFGDILGPTYNRAVDVVTASMVAAVAVVYRTVFGHAMTGHLMEPSSCAPQATVVLPPAEDFMMLPLEDLDVFITSSLATVGERGLIPTSYEEKRVRIIQATKSVGPQVTNLVFELQGETLQTIELVTRFQASLPSLDIKPTLPQQTWDFVIWLKESVNGVRTADLASQLRAGLIKLLERRRAVLSTAISEGSEHGSNHWDDGVGIQEVRTGVCSIAEEGERQLALWQRLGNCDGTINEDCVRDMMAAGTERSRVLAQLKASCAALVHASSRHQRLLNLAFKERSFVIRTIGKLETAAEEDVRSVLEVAANGHLDLLGGYYNMRKR